MHCKNCELTLQTHHNFCHSCGAKVIRKRLTFKALFSHFIEQYVNYDNKFLQTFLHLFSQPENVIGVYINGTRKKYVNVISYFALALTISGIQLYILTKYFPGVMDLSSITVAGQEEMANKNLQFVQEYQSVIMLFYVPIYALMSRTVFFNDKKFNYTEHLVIFMYILAQVSLVSAILTVICAFFGVTIGTISIITMPLQVIYSAYCLKRLYSLNLSGILIRTLLFLVVLLIMFVIASVVMAIIMYLNGDMQEMMENKRANQQALGNFFIHKLNFI